MTAPHNFYLRADVETITGSSMLSLLCAKHRICVSEIQLTHCPYHHHHMYTQHKETKSEFFFQGDHINTNILFQKYLKEKRKIENVGM